MASSAMGLNLGVFGFLPTIHVKTNTKQMRPRSSRTMRHFNVCLSLRSDRSRCRWHTHLKNHIYFDYGKNPNTLILAPCRDQNGTGSGISLVHLRFYPISLNFSTCLFSFNPATISLLTCFNDNSNFDISQRSQVCPHHLVVWREVQWSPSVAITSMTRQKLQSQLEVGHT